VSTSLVFMLYANECPLLVIAGGLRIHELPYDGSLCSTLQLNHAIAISLKQASASWLVTLGQQHDCEQGLPRL
jgi:hypothetical protein